MRSPKFLSLGLLAAALLVTATPGCATEAADEDAAVSEAELEEATTRPTGIYEATALPKKVAYLTFDDGPGAWTSAVLDVLRDEGAKATFFVCSHANDRVKPAAKHGLAPYRGELLRMLDEGHVIGNHTTHHHDLAKLSAGDVAEELDRNERELNDVLVKAGRSPVALTTIRPPFGSPFKNGGASAVVGPAFARRGINVLWNADSGDSSGWVRGDWLEPSRYSDSLFYDPSRPEFQAKVRDVRAASLAQADGRGLVILFHDIHATTRDALRPVVQELKRRGYTFGTAEDLSRAALQRPSADASPACERFRETGQETCGRLRDFWASNGALPVFGFPTAPASARRSADGKTYYAQWFERNRLEVHPENARPYHVLLGRLGVEALERQRRDWAREFAPEQPRPGCTYFAETKHNVCDERGGLGFKTYWEGRGLAGLRGREASLALFGLPLSDAHEELVGPDRKRLRVQWFERARMEWHPGNPDGSKVLLGLLGNELR